MWSRDLQPLHHHLAQRSGSRSRVASERSSCVLDLLHDRVDLRGATGRFAAATSMLRSSLRRSYGSTSPAALHHLQRPLLDVLVRREAAAALQALAPPAHRPPLAAAARVDDPVLE